MLLPTSKSLGLQGLQKPQTSLYANARKNGVVARSWFLEKLQPRSEFTEVDIKQDPEAFFAQLPVNSTQKIKVLPSGKVTVVPATSTPSVPAKQAKDVIIKFYEAYNSGDLKTIESLLAEDVVYHDMALYQDPFMGRAEVMDFMKKVVDTVPSDFKFVIDDITGGDANKVGIIWHTELEGGTVFPFSRGCSFYTVNDKGLITYARDLVETPSKAGDSGLKAVSALAPLIRKLGPKADPENLKNLPIAAAAVWALYIGYSSYILFSNDAPGLPALEQPPEVLLEVFNESLNFFYVNIGLSELGLTFVPSVPSNPVSEAVFNFVAAWGVLFLPVILTEKKSEKVGNKYAWWTGIMFLTNVFFIPFLALRAAPEPQESTQSNGVSSSSAAAASEDAVQVYPSWTKTAAGVGLAVGVFSLWWAVGARPEYGDLTARLDYFTEQFYGNRVFFAFIVDATLYSIWQAAMLSTVPGVATWQRFTPFFGLAAHLLSSPVEEKSTDA